MEGMNCMYKIYIVQQEVHVINNLFCVLVFKLIEPLCTCTGREENVFKYDHFLYKHSTKLHQGCENIQPTTGHFVTYFHHTPN